MRLFEYDERSPLASISETYAFQKVRLYLPVSSDYMMFIRP